MTRDAPGTGSRFAVTVDEPEQGSRVPLSAQQEVHAASRPAPPDLQLLPPQLDGGGGGADGD